MSYSSSIFNILLSKIEDFSIEAFSSGSTVLGEIAHSLSGKCSLKKGIERLSRHLAEEFPKGWEKNYRHLISRIMPQKRLIFCVDDSDIAKIYGKKFQGLGTVRDASSPDKKLVK